MPVRIPNPINATLDRVSAWVVAPARRYPTVAYGLACLGAALAAAPWLGMYTLVVAVGSCAGFTGWAAGSYRRQRIEAERDQALRDVGRLSHEVTTLKARLASDTILTRRLPQIRGGDEL
jgi:hypothetical protein